MSLVLVAARKKAKRHAKGSPGLLAPSCYGMFCLPSLGSIISVEYTSLLPSSFINLPLKHTTKKSFKNGERFCSSPLISRLVEGVHRDTDCTCCIIGQAVQHYFFIAISAPHSIPVFDALRKAITQFTFLKEYLQAQETLHQTGSV